MHREHLHGIGGHLDVSLVQSALLRLGSIKPGQETAQGGPIGRYREAGRHLRERVQMSARRSRRVLWAGQHLNIQAESTLGLPGKIRQGHAGHRAQRPDRLTQPVQAP